MNTTTIDNGIDTELDRCITWQFDNATNIVGVINTLRDFFNQSTKTMWDNWRTNVADIDNANDFGLSVWGKLLDCRRPYLTYGQPAQTVVLNQTLYRKILKARFQLLGKNASMKSYCEYLYAVFGGKMKATDGLEMNLTFSQTSGLTLEEIALIQQAPDVVFIYPAGVKNNTIRASVAFGICDTRGSGWNGSFPKGQITRLDGGTFIWRGVIHSQTLFEVADGMNVIFERYGMTNRTSHSNTVTQLANVINSMQSVVPVISPSSITSTDYTVKICDEYDKMNS